jgi:hypothetical protein
VQASERQARQVETKPGRQAKPGAGKPGGGKVEANWKASKGRKGMPRQGLFGPAKAQEVCHELGYVTTHIILSTFISASMPLTQRTEQRNRGTEAHSVPCPTPTRLEAKHGLVAKVLRRLLHIWNPCQLGQPLRQLLLQVAVEPLRLAGLQVGRQVGRE